MKFSPGIIVLIVAWICSAIVAIFCGKPDTLLVPAILTILYGFYKICN